MFPFYTRRMKNLFLVLLATFTLLLVFFFFTLSASQKLPSSVSISDVIQENTPIELSVTGIRSRRVASCVWYADDEVRLREDRLCTYTPDAEDAEHWIKVVITLSDGSSYTDSRYFSILPILWLESDTPYCEVSKETDTPVQMHLSAGSPYQSPEEYEGAAAIHLRGNSTSELDKLPFKLQLDNSSNLLGLGDTSHWVLLANAIDATLLRNRIFYDLARDMGADVSVPSEFVTLFYNGEYYGVYQLCPQIRISDNSVRIYDWEEHAKDASRTIINTLSSRLSFSQEEQEALQELLKDELSEDLSWLETGVFSSSVLQEASEESAVQIPTRFTLEELLPLSNLPDVSGGILLETDFREKGSASILTNYHTPYYFNRPVYGNTFSALYDYMEEYLQATEYAFHSSDFVFHNADTHYRVAEEGWFDWGYEFIRLGVAYEPVEFSSIYDGYHYSQLADFDSLMLNFFLCELSMNWDGMKNSVFLYKDMDDLLHIGPFWDFDCTCGNSMFGLETRFPEEWHTINDYFANEFYYQTVQWNRYLIRDPYFLVQSSEYYHKIRETLLEELIKDGGLIDQYAREIRPAALANDQKWGGCMGTFEGQKFDEGIQMLKDFLRKRIAWMDRQFQNPETLCTSLGYYITSPDIQIEKPESLIGQTIAVTVSSALPDCHGISLQVNGTSFFTESLQNGQAVFELPRTLLKDSPSSLCTIQARALDREGNYIVNPEGTVYGDYENAYSNYIWFPVS